MIYTQLAWNNLTKGLSCKTQFFLFSADCTPARLRCGAGGNLGTWLCGRSSAVNNS